MTISRVGKVIVGTIPYVDIVTLFANENLFRNKLYSSINDRNKEICIDTLRAGC